MVYIFSPGLLVFNPLKHDLLNLKNITIFSATYMGAQNYKLGHPVKIFQLMAAFISKKSLESFDKNSAVKLPFKKDKGCVCFYLYVSMQ